MAKQVVIVIPGVGDMVRIHTITTAHWRLYGLSPQIFRMSWVDDEPYAQKIERLVDHIDRLHKQGNQVSLVGTSAGGSVAINNFLERTQRIHKVVTLGARLRRGEETSYKLSVLPFPQYVESIRCLEPRLKKLSQEIRQSILTMRAEYGDPLVPDDTAVIEGVKNLTVPLRGHVISIGMMMTFFAKPIVDFLKH